METNSAKRVPLPFLICLLLGACAVCPDFEKFSELKPEAVRAVIPKCSPDEQVALYLEWNRARFGIIPSISGMYAGDIAKTGKALIPSLLERLENRAQLREEWERIEILDVFSIMQKRGYYAVARDEEVMSRIERAVDLIEDNFVKDAALETVRYIKADL